MTVSFQFPIIAAEPATGARIQLPRVGRAKKVINDSLFRFTVFRQVH